MSGMRPARVVRQLEQAVQRQDTTDGELIDQFVRGRDQAAFEQLVRRHGPMVLTVCRRVTGHSQDAEDAFQAVFLVFARKMASIRTPERLGNWLYGVAVRVARRARRSATRRRGREVQVVDLPDPPAPPAGSSADVGLALHEELDKLPAWYRDAIVLCDLRGIGRTDAARVLGIPEGTLSSRLAGGRRKLSERLVRRGITLAAGMIPAALCDGRAAVPDSVVVKTRELVAGWSAGAGVPTAVLRLVQGGSTVRTTFLIGIMSAALAAGVVYATGADAPPPPPGPQATGATAGPKPVVLPAPKTPTSDGPGGGQPRMRKALDLPIHLQKAAQAVPIQSHKNPQVVWRADGRALAITGVKPLQQQDGKPLPIVLVLEERDGVFRAQSIDLPPARRLVGFAPDGKLITDLREYDLASGFHRFQYWDVPLVEFETFLNKPVPVVAEPMAPGAPRVKARTEPAEVATVDLDADQTYGYAFAQDGKTFRTVYREDVKPWVYNKIEVREVSAASGKTLKTVLKIDGEYEAVSLSPTGGRIATYDGKTLSCWDLDRPDAAPWRRAIEMTGVPEIRFSPDAGRIAVVRAEGRPVVFDAATGGRPRDLAGDAGLVAEAGHSCFSPNGGLIVLSGDGYFVETQTSRSFASAPFLKVWDTETGKVVKSWNRSARVAFAPNAPVLAVLEEVGGEKTRLGFWDFSTTPTEK